MVSWYWQVAVTLAALVTIVGACYLSWSLVSWLVRSASRRVARWAARLVRARVSRREAAAAGFGVVGTAAVGLGLAVHQGWIGLEWVLLAAVVVYIVASLGLLVYAQLRKLARVKAEKAKAAAVAAANWPPTKMKADLETIFAMSKAPAAPPVPAAVPAVIPVPPAPAAAPRRVYVPMTVPGPAPSPAPAADLPPIPLVEPRPKFRRHSPPVVPVPHRPAPRPAAPPAPVPPPLPVETARPAAASESLQKLDQLLQEKSRAKEAKSAPPALEPQPAATVVIHPATLAEVLNGQAGDDELDDDDDPALTPEEAAQEAAEIEAGWAEEAEAERSDQEDEAREKARQKAEAKARRERQKGFTSETIKSRGRRLRDREKERQQKSD